MVGLTLTYIKNKQANKPILFPEHNNEETLHEISQEKRKVILHLVFLSFFLERCTKTKMNSRCKWLRSCNFFEYKYMSILLSTPRMYKPRSYFLQNFCSFQSSKSVRCRARTYNALVEVLLWRSCFIAAWSRLVTEKKVPEFHLSFPSTSTPFENAWNITSRAAYTARCHG